MQTGGGYTLVQEVVKYLLKQMEGGIKDSSPSYELDVNGDIRATGDVMAFSMKGKRKYSYNR